MIFQSNHIYMQDITAWAPGLDTPQAWQAWAKNPIPITEHGRITVQHIPAMVKRRCSELSKMSLEASQQCLDSQAADYTVFCSHHGELQTSADLLKKLHAQTSLSPMKFVQSVHNTAAGLLAILQQSQHNATAIGAGDNSFFMGLVEAANWLRLYPEQQVLLCMADDSVPSEYDELNIARDEQYVLAMLLTSKATDKKRLRFSLSQLSKPATATQLKLPPALAFFAWWLTADTPRFTQFSSQLQLDWEQD